MELCRQTRWNHAANTLLLIKPELASTARMLGKFDAELSDQDTQYRVWRNSTTPLTSEQWNQLHESFGLAHLWVLGAYELIRTLDQLLRNKSGLEQTTGSRSRDVKRRFEQVRIPLAKLEAPRHNFGAGHGVAYPALNATHGIAWKVSETCVIGRSELSDLLLGFLEHLRYVRDVA